MNIANFPARRAEPEKTRVRAYAVMGYCESGFLMGHAIRHVAESISDEQAFCFLVREVFDGVKGLRFGVVLGPQQMAVPTTAEPAPAA